MSALSTFQQFVDIQSIVKCDEDIRKDSHAKVVLPSGVAIFLEIGEQMASERRSQFGRTVGPS